MSWKSGLVGLVMLTAVGAVSAADWPQYRADAARSGYTAEQLPAKLEPQWVFKPTHPPQISWPGESRVTYDHANHVAIAGDTVFFGSSADCQVHALDAATGARRWTFFTGGPVRCAPAVWKDKVLAASDDGYLYCLSAADGSLVWRTRGGPGDSMVIGNGRLISKWPARGGPVVADGVVYFAAGLWPADGTYLYALEAETGRQIWRSEAGTVKRLNPHVKNVEETGFGFQGYIALTKDLVLAPTGRGLAAAFDRKTGELRWFPVTTQGGTALAAVDALVFSGGCVFDAGKGKEMTRGIDALSIAASPEWILHGTPTVLTALDRPCPFSLAEKPLAGKPSYVANAKWSIDGGKAGGGPLIVAGGRVYSAGGNRMIAVDMADRKITWSATVDAAVCGLAASGGRLVVSTSSGSIHCFGDRGTEGRTECRSVQDGLPIRPASDPYGASGPHSAAAEDILATGVTEGYCVDLGCGDGQLAFELARRSNLFICGVEKDPARAAEARRRLAAAGLYGVRVTVHEADPAKTGYPRRFANLVVSGRSVLEGPGEVNSQEAVRLQRPWGGTIAIGRPGQMRKEVRGALEGAGQWTHQYGSAAAMSSSEDLLVRGPLTIRWFGPSEIDVPNRHGRPPAPLCFEGILYTMAVNSLDAVDAYNGRVMWRAPFEGIGKPYDAEHLLGTAGTNSTFCVAPEGVFVRCGGKCIRLDRKTGRRLGEFSSGGESVWGFVACDAGLLLGSEADTRHQVPYYYGKSDMTSIFTESKNLFALEATSGRPRWTYRPKHSIRNNAIVVGGGKVFLIDRPKAEEQPRRQPIQKPHALGELVCLDAATGKELWRGAEDIWGTVLALSTKHDVLLMSGQPAFSVFGMFSDEVQKLAAFRASRGQLLWKADERHIHRPVIVDRTVYLDRGKFDLLDGRKSEWRPFRSHGCGMVVGGANLLLFRSAVLGYIDLAAGGPTRHFGAVRPGCWVNAIPAEGMVLMPDFSQKCTCSYDNKASLALESPEPGEAGR